MPGVENLPNPYPIHPGAVLCFRVATDEEVERFGLDGIEDPIVVVIRYDAPFVVPAVDRTFLAVE